MLMRRRNFGSRNDLGVPPVEIFGEIHEAKDNLSEQAHTGDTLEDTRSDRYVSDEYPARKASQAVR